MVKEPEMDDSEDALLSLHTTSREATGAGASTVVYGTRSSRGKSYNNEIHSVVSEPLIDSQAITQGIPVQAQNHDVNNAVYVSNGTRNSLLPPQPRSSINSHYEEESLSLATKRNLSATCTKLKLFCGCKVICTVIIFVFILSSLGPIFTVTMILPESKNRSISILPGDTILMEQISPFWYDRATVAKTSLYDKQDDFNDILLYTTPCRDLVTNERDLTLKSSPLCTKHGIFVLVPITNYIDESTIDINITLINSTDPNVNVMVGLARSDNYGTYSTFEEGEALTNGSNVIPKTIPYAKKVHNQSWTIIDYTIPVTGYYFVGVSLFPQNAQVCFQYDYHIHHYFYSQTDYATPVCTINPDSQMCSLEIMKNLANSEALPTCLLVYVDDVDGSQEPPTHVDVRCTVGRILWNIYALTFGSLFIGSVIVAVVVSVVYLLYCVCVWRRHYVMYVKL